MALFHDPAGKTNARSYRRPFGHYFQAGRETNCPKSVHRLRTTIRSIESLVSYAHPDLDKKLERSLEKMADLRKRAGKVRDLDVQLGCWTRSEMDLRKRSQNSDSDSWKRKEIGRQNVWLADVKKIQESKFFARMDRIAEKAGETSSEANRPLAPLEEAKCPIGGNGQDFPSHQDNQT